MAIQTQIYKIILANINIYIHMYIVHTYVDREANEYNVWHNITKRTLRTMRTL